MASRLLASGTGWTVQDIACTAGPTDPSYEERHESVCIAAVIRGTFQYRTVSGTMTLASGAVLLGDVGQSFECGHEHGVGDRCISFHLAPELFEEVLASSRGICRMPFGIPGLAPSPMLTPLIAATETAYGDAMHFEELLFRLAGAVVATLSRTRQTITGASRRDERCVSEVLRYIEVSAHEPITLAETRKSCRDEPIPFPAHVPVCGRNHPASICLVAALASGGGKNPPFEQFHLSYRLRSWLQRPVLIQSEISEDYGHDTY